MKEAVSSVANAAFNEDKDVLEAIQTTYDLDFRGVDGAEFSVAADRAAIAARRIVERMVELEGLRERDGSMGSTLGTT